jgi:hypothetical protein
MMPDVITPATNPPRSAVRRTAALASLAYVAFGLLLPHLPVPPLRTLPFAARLALVVVPTALFMLLQLWLAWAVVHLTPRPARAAVLTLLSIVLWALTLLFVHPLRHNASAANVAALLIRPTLLGFFVTLAGTFGGVLLSRIVRERNVLLPVALVAMPIDYLGAMTPIGFTHDAVQRHPSIVHDVSVPVPTVGSLHPIGFIGPGDALFIAFYFAAILRLGMNGRGTFRLMYVLLTLTLLYVLLPNSLPVAALVPMGFAVIIANARLFTLKRDEVFAMLYAAALVVALVAGFYVYSHRHFYHSAHP